MKCIVLIALIALGLPALAQDKPAAGPESPKPAASQDAAKPKPVARKHGPKRGEDARQCLEKTSNTEVIKCAEEYL
ncbi:MAG: hypothetical protein QOD26_3714 [Betaproteobacteria bacterium]|jgi:hypothetical protein|nr:hypothetical protein [Betaproteobacteria bacterium]